MKALEIKVGGIDRHTNACDAAGDICEELINIRPESGGLKIVKPVKEISANLRYKKILVHHINSIDNWIGVTPDNSVVWFNKDTGEVIYTFCAVSGVADVYLCTQSNLLIVSDKKTIINRVYVYDSGAYKTLYSGDVSLPTLPRLSMRRLSMSEYDCWQNITVLGDDVNEKSPISGQSAVDLLMFTHYLTGNEKKGDEFNNALKATLQSAWNRILAMDKHLAEGYVLVGTTVTLFDGSETGFSNLQLVDCSLATPYRNKELPGDYTFDTGELVYTIKPEANSLDGIFLQVAKTEDVHTMYLALQPKGGRVYGRDNNKGSDLFHTLTLNITADKSLVDIKDLVKSVNLYVSDPLTKIDWDNFSWKIKTQAGVTYSSGSASTVVELLKGNDNTNYMAFYAPLRHPYDCKEDLHKRLLFKQKEFSITEFTAANAYSVQHLCEFGLDTNTTEPTLAVDNWNTKRAGQMYLYNSRIHFFDCAIRLNIPDKDIVNINGWDDPDYLKDSIEVINSTASGATTTATYMHVAYCDDPHNSADAPVTTEVRAYIGFCCTHDQSPDLLSKSAYYWFKYHDLNNTGRGLEWADGAGEYTFVRFSDDYGNTLTDNNGLAEGKYIGYILPTGTLPTSDAAADAPTDLSKYTWGYYDEGAYVDVIKPDNTQGRKCTVIAYLSDNNKTLTIRHEDIFISFVRTFDAVTRLFTLTKTAVLSGMITYPDSRCKRLVIQFKEGGVVYGTEIVMTSDKAAYNFAYAYINSPHVLFAVREDNTDVTTNTYEEYDTVNVSAINNPVVLPVQDSYRFLGKVTGLACAYDTLQVTKSGQYPLYVLTDRGIFALELGTGTVLYAAIIAINNHRTSSQFIQTRRGICYIADGNVYELVGRDSVLLSMPLDGNPDYDIRNNANFAKCFYTGLYDVQNYMSNCTLMEFLSGAVMLYNSFRDELIISNSNVEYSFVFNFISHRWHKITEQYQEMIENNTLVRSLEFTKKTGSKATGKISLGPTVIEVAKTFAYTSVAATGNTTFNANAGDRVALVLDGSQVAAITLSAAATLPTILALLCGDIDYLEDRLIDSGNNEVNGVLTPYDSCAVYINLSASYAGKTLSIVNLTSAARMDIIISADSGTATIPAKGIGYQFKIGLKNTEADAVTLTDVIEVAASDNVTTIVAAVATAINAIKGEITATTEANSILLTYMSIGEEGNKITPILSNVNVMPSRYFNFTFAGLAGGMAPQLIPSDYSVILDTSDEIDSDARLIHAQTRPFSLEKLNYNLLRRLILQVKCALNSAQNLSVYVYCSNNLAQWECVALSQKSNCILDRLRTNRTALHYKYFVVTIGGIVSTTTSIGSLAAEVDNILTAHLR